MLPALSHNLVLGARGTFTRQVRFSSKHSGSITSSCDAFSPTSVLSSESRHECMQRLKNTQSLRPPKDESESARKAAVLVPLCIVDGQVSLLYTLRSPFMSTHRGQVSFPGGMKDETDETFEATATRETEEELGIPREQIQVWGECRPMAARNGVTVVPVVGSLGHIKIDELDVNLHEVGEVFSMPLQMLCDPCRFRYTQFRNGQVVPVYLGGNHRIWGLTAGITFIFLNSLLPNIHRNKLHLLKPI